MTSKNVFTLHSFWSYFKVALFLDLPKSLPRQKHKMMTSAKERHKAEETCIVASRERDHFSKDYSLTNSRRVFCLKQSYCFL